MTQANTAQRTADAAKRRQWDFIRAYYAENEAAILEAKHWQWGVPINEVDWRSMFSPIESAMWDAIRMEGAIFYPQWPVAGFFLDFGNPQAKIAIECDGFHWHMDRARDHDRDAKLREIGWTVFRVSGAKCMTETRFDREDNEVELSHPTLLLRQLVKLYPISGRSPKPNQPTEACA
jgi:very-short-patch-repair endonuclease